MIYIFDNDGVLLDSRENSFTVHNRVAGELGVPPIGLNEYRLKMNSRNWVDFCVSVGIPKDLAPTFISRFQEVYPKQSLPPLIPGAQELISSLLARRATLYFVTNGTLPRMKEQFERDGWQVLLPFVRTPMQGKTKELFDIAKEHEDQYCFFFDDMVSGGKCAYEARQMGATNLIFVGVTSEYGWHHAHMLEDFAKEHPDMATTIDSLEQILKFS